MESSSKRPLHSLCYDYKSQRLLFNSACFKNVQRSLQTAKINKDTNLHINSFKYSGESAEPICAASSPFHFNTLMALYDGEVCCAQAESLAKYSKNQVKISKLVQVSYQHEVLAITFLKNSTSNHHQQDFKTGQITGVSYTPAKEFADYFVMAIDIGVFFILDQKALFSGEQNQAQSRIKNAVISSVGNTEMEMRQSSRGKRKQSRPAAPQ